MSLYPVKRPEDYTKQELYLIACVETARAVNKCNDTVGKMFNRILPPPTVILDLRGNHMAGEAWRRRDGIEYVIRLNEGLMRQNVEDYITSTIPHEVAHLVANYVWKANCHHDSRWKYVMEEVLGIAAERCHNYRHVSDEVKAACKRRD